MRLSRFTLAAVALLVVAGSALAQRPASPRGEAAIQVGGEYEGRRYVGGKWISVDYGRPILRGRTGFFGEGADYGRAANAGAPVWRAGANKSTRLTTEVDLKFGEEIVPAGEYSMFVELKEGDWTLILSTHAAKDGFREPGEGLWGAYNYTPDKDVLRVSMNVSSMPVSYEQFTISFVDVTDSGGTLAMMWEKHGCNGQLFLALARSLSGTAHRPVLPGRRSPTSGAATRGAATPAAPARIRESLMGRAPARP